MKPRTLRVKLQRMHAAAEAAIVPGMDYATWYAEHGEPPMVLLIEHFYAALDSGVDVQAFARLAAEFRPRENVLIARAWAAAHPTDDHARMSLAVEQARAEHPHRDIPPISYWTNRAIEHVVAGGTSMHGVSLSLNGL